MMFIFNINALPSILCSMFLLALGYFVFLTNRSKTNFLFSCLTLSAAIWQLGTALTLLSATQEIAFFWTKMTYIGVTLIPVTMFHFIVNLLSIKKCEKYIAIAYLTALFVLIPLTWANVFLNGVYQYPWGYWFKATAIHPLHILSYSSLFFINLLILYFAYQDNNRQDKDKIRYLLVALLVSYGGALDYLPDYGINIYPIGYIFAVICLSLIAYAILRHRLMDIKVAIKRTAVYSILTAALTGIFLSFILLGEFFFRGLVGYSSVWVAILAAFVVALAFQPLRGKTQGVVDRLFYKGEYDYRDTLKNLSHASATIIDLDKLISSTSDSVSMALKPEKITFYLLDKEKGLFKLKAS